MACKALRSFFTVLIPSYRLNISNLLDLCNRAETGHLAGVLAMGMRTIFQYPPNYVAIRKAFDLRGAKPIFAYGDVIFNPHKCLITPALRAHEEVHSARQGDDPAGWWKQYIASKEFRLAEELPAHVVEWQTLGGTEEQLDFIAGRLAAPIYGPMVSKPHALELLRAANGR